MKASRRHSRRSDRSTGQLESVPGVVYNTESGFVRESDFNASSTRLALASLMRRLALLLGSPTFRLVRGSSLAPTAFRCRFRTPTRLPDRSGCPGAVDANGAGGTSDRLV